MPLDAERKVEAKRAAPSDGDAKLRSALEKAEREKLSLRTEIAALKAAADQTRKETEAQLKSTQARAAQEKADLEARQREKDKMLKEAEAENAAKDKELTSLKTALAKSDAKLTVLAEKEALVSKLQSELKELPRQTLLHSSFEELSFERLLGKGALGTVRSARWRSCLVAVKLVEGISDEETKLLLNEINVLRKASHPGVVRLLGVCVEPARMALVMEYLPGGDLASAIKAGKFGLNHIEVRLCGSFSEDFRRRAYKCAERLHLCSRSCTTTAKSLVTATSSQKISSLTATGVLKWLTLAWRA